MIPRASVGVTKRNTVSSKSKESFGERKSFGQSVGLSWGKGDTEVDMSSGLPEAQDRKLRERLGIAHIVLLGCVISIITWRQELRMLGCLSFLRRDHQDLNFF